MLNNLPWPRRGRKSRTQGDAQSLPASQAGERSDTLLTSPHTVPEKIGYRYYAAQRSRTYGIRDLLTARMVAAELAAAGDAATLGDAATVAGAGLFALLLLDLICVSFGWSGCSFLLVDFLFGENSLLFATWQSPVERANEIWEAHVNISDVRRRPKTTKDVRVSWDEDLTVLSYNAKTIESPRKSTEEGTTRREAMRSNSRSAART